MFDVVLLGPDEPDGGGELTLELLGPVREPFELVVLPTFDGRAESVVPS